MFWNLFDLRYERNLEEALMFYFFYVIFCFLISGVFYSSANFLYFLSSYFSGIISIILTYYIPFLTFFTPFIFYTYLSIILIFKKKLKDRYSLYLVFYTILITFFIPLTLGTCFGLGFLGYTKGFKYGIAAMFIDFFFPCLFLGCIPIMLLSTREDNSLKSEIQEIEREKLENQRKIEKQLLIEHVIKIRQDEFKNNLKSHLNDDN